MTFRIKLLHLHLHRSGTLDVMWLLKEREVELAAHIGRKDSTGGGTFGKGQNGHPYAMLG